MPKVTIKAAGRTTMIASWIVVTITVLSGVVFFWRLEIALGRMRPPEDVVDLDTFLEEMPAPSRGFVMRIAGEEYVELEGPMMSHHLMPSGPPAYVFDSSLRLVDWSSDIGDDPKFVSEWRNGYRRVLGPEELTLLVNRRQAAAWPVLSPSSPRESSR